VVRAGFGIFFDRYNLSFVFVTYPELPVVIPGGQHHSDKARRRGRGLELRERNVAGAGHAPALQR